MAQMRFTVVQPKETKNIRFTVVQPKTTQLTQAVQPTPSIQQTVQQTVQQTDPREERIKSLANNITQVGSTLKNLQQKAQPFLQQDLKTTGQIKPLQYQTNFDVNKDQGKTTNVFKEKAISDLQNTYTYKQDLSSKLKDTVEGKTGQENLLSTAGAVVKDLTKGIFGFGENIADLGTYGAATLMGLTGREDLKEALIKNAKADSTGQLFKNADEYYNYTAEKGFKEGEAGSAIAQGIGHIAGAIGLGGLLPSQISQIKLNKIPLVNKIPLLKGLQLPTTSVLSGTGGGMSEALNEGATFEQAGVYGVGKGLLTGISEAIFGSVIGGKTGEALKKAYGSNQLDDVFVNYLTKNMGKGGSFATKLAYSGIGEGLEENIEGLLTPYLKRMTYDEKAELYTSQEALTDFMMGAVVALMVQSPSLARQVNQQAQQTGKTEQEVIKEAIKDIQPPAIADKNIETALNGEIDKAILQQTSRPKIEPIQQQVKPLTETTKQNIATPIQKITPTQQGTEKIIAQTKQRSVIQNIVENQNIPSEVKTNLKSDDRANYMTVTDEDALNVASESLTNKGTAQAYKQFKDRINKFESLSKYDVAEATLIANDLFAKGDTKKYQEVITDLAVNATRTGQANQALSILYRLTPDGRLLAIQKHINQINNDHKNDKKWQPLALDNSDITNIKQAKDKDALNKAVNSAIEHLSAKMPKTITNKINEWRYLSMLGNPKTHIRNVIANIAMRGTATAKTKLAAIMEDVIKPRERTKTLKKPSKKTLDFVEQDVITQKERIKGSDKYDVSKESIKPKQSKLAAFNSNMLELEDWWSSSIIYKNNMADYITANNLDVDNIGLIELEKARAYAIEQAQEQTFRTASKLANALAKIEKQNMLGKLVIGGILPFKTTPINIAKTSIEYSPVGLIKAITKDISDVKQGKITATKYIDNLSKGLTGTGIALMGYFLSQMGVLRASGSDEDREKWYEQSLGKQPYSLNIGDMSFTIDWLSPSAVPLFVGAELSEMQQKGMSANQITASIDALSTVLDPLTEMSLLQGVSKTIKSFDTNAITGVALNTAMNYAGQFIPTVSGQIARTEDDTRRSTVGEGKGIEKKLKTFVNQQIAKIPVLSRTLEPYLDEFGREVKTGDLPTRALQNFISPSYIKQIKINKIDKKLLDLYTKTGETSVLPTTPSRYITHDKETIYFTPAEYTKFAKTDGKTVLTQLQEFVNSGRYNYLSDEEKIKKITEIYRKGQKQAKEEFLRNRKEDK